MIEAPFLELAYYLGERRAGSVVRQIVRSATLKHEVHDAVSPGDVLEQVFVSNGMLVLRREGAPFCGTERSNVPMLRHLGELTHRRFLDVADAVLPSYAAILIEYSLEEPSDYSLCSSLAFRNFYINREIFGQPAVSRILSAAGDDVYTQATLSGVYVSMSSEFNPRGVGIQADDAMDRSMKIGQIVSQVMRGS